MRVAPNRFRLINAGGTLGFVLTDSKGMNIGIHDRVIFCKCIGEPYVSEIVADFNDKIEMLEQQINVPQGGKDNEMERPL